MKLELVEELHKIAADIKNIDHCYGSGLLVPLGNKVSGSRQAMSYSQFSQAKNLVHPQIARMVTGYEKLFGDRSTSYYKSERNFEVVKKIKKFDNDYMYALIVKDVDSNYYDIIFRNEAESFAESSGVQIDNDIIDKKKPGDSIKKNDVIYKSRSYDENMNYRLGINAKAVYLIDPAIVEDAFRISDVLRDRLECYEVNQYKIPKNSNDIFLNLYGNSEEYKIFPDIGEKVKNKVLCARRRVDYNNAQYMLKSKNLRKEMFGDTVYTSISGKAKVVDIDIFCNANIDDIPKDRVNHQLLYYLKTINNYWENLYEALKEITDNPNNKYSDNVGIAYARAKDRLSIGKNIKWDDDGSIFDHMVIHITTMNTKKAEVGSKLVGREGNKGVISEIVPSEQMPRSEDGEYAEIVFSALSVIGRLNPAQLYELELNWIVDAILSGDVSNKQKFESLMIFLEICNPDQKDSIEKFYDSLSKDERKQFLKEITTDFVVFQPASMSISLKNYEKLIDKFEPKKKKFTIEDEKGTVFNIQNKMIMSDTYIFRLKHEPITKFSVRSKGTINPRTFLPIKSHAYSRGTAMFNNQAIRIGNMEMDILNLCNDPAAINYFTRLYCTSVVGRRKFSKLLETNVFTDELEIEMDDYKSRVVDWFNVTLLTCGMGFEFEYDGNEEFDIDPNESLNYLQDMSKNQIRIMFKEGYVPNFK